jgi:hypothetical protein
LSEPTTVDEAVALLGDLIAALQGFGMRSARACVAEVFEALTGKDPSASILNEILGDDTRV